MGLSDILNGMLNGPRGPKSPQPSGGGGGMSPITLALLALLAYKAYQGGMFGGGKDAPQTSPFPPLPGGKGETNASTGGGLGDLLGGILGGGRGGPAANSSGGGGLGDLLGPILAGGAAGGILSGGLGELLKQMQQHGQGKVADSWVGTGQNQQIAPKEIESTFGSDIIDALVRQTGESKGNVLADLAKDLPGLVDMLTPGGKVPTEKDISRML